MWTTGMIHYHGQEVDYIAKVSDQASEFGIDGGRVFKLDIEVAGECIASYDRGWDTYPETDKQETMLESVLAVLPV
ncbi:hypothetical protein ABNB56_09935 [Streptococcus iniae]|uniref:DUF7678 domain-containing protein n=1 Tax=Streptococcus iniae TaxID=1346 RepID=UPI000EFBD24F|nr:hypothetical protein [Streptococcus iniae]RMI73777.1 hypothetical protein DIX58_09980 [Streptococcus iniae]